MLDVFIAIRFPTLATSTEEVAITHPCPSNLINYNGKKIVKKREIKKCEQNNSPTKRKIERIYIYYSSSFVNYHSKA